MRNIESKLLNILSAGSKSKSPTDFNSLEYYLTNYPNLETYRVITLYDDHEDI